MALLQEQVLVCPVCRQTKNVPICCGREMEYDSHVFFCTFCNKELKPSSCCNHEMTLNTISRDIRKELFGAI